MVIAEIYAKGSRDNLSNERVFAWGLGNGLGIVYSSRCSGLLDLSQNLVNYSNSQTKISSSKIYRLHKIAHALTSEE